MLYIILQLKADEEMIEVEEVVLVHRLVVVELGWGNWTKRIGWLSGIT